MAEANRNERVKLLKNFISNTCDTYENMNWKINPRTTASPTIMISCENPPHLESKCPSITPDSSIFLKLWVRDHANEAYTPSLEEKALNYW